VRRAALLLLLAGLLLSGLGPALEPSVCTGCCPVEEGGDCADLSCPDCVSLAVVRLAPEAPVRGWTAVDLGEAGTGLPLVPVLPPASEILHVPRHLLS